MGKTIVVYGSSTGTCEAIAGKIAEKLGVEAINVSDLTADVIAENDNNVVLSARNMADVNTTLVGTINVYDILNAKTLVLTKDAVEKIEEVYA